MQPNENSKIHPAGTFLLQYERNGYPVDVGWLWIKLEIMTTAERGPHKSNLALDTIEIMHMEVKGNIKD